MSIARSGSPTLAKSFVVICLAPALHLRNESNIFRNETGLEIGQWLSAVTAGTRRTPFVIAFTRFPSIDIAILLRPKDPIHRLDHGVFHPEGPTRTINFHFNAEIDIFKMLLSV